MAAGIYRQPRQENDSIFLQPDDSDVMTPLYDGPSLSPYTGDRPPRFNRRQAEMAMALRAKNAHYQLQTIHARHWNDVAMKHAGPAVRDAMPAPVALVGPDSTTQCRRS